MAALVAACGGPTTGTPPPAASVAVAPSPTPAATPFVATPSVEPVSPSPASSVSPSPPAAATPSVPPGPFAVVGTAPVIARTVVPDIYSTLISGVGGDGPYHAWVIGFRDDPSGHQLYHFRSPDGIDWTVDPGEAVPVRGVEFSDPGAFPSSVFRDDGRWVMYLSAIEAPAREGFELWRATAQEPSGPWRVDPEPALARGPLGAWDSMAVDFPAVFATDDGYGMLYQGSTRLQPTAGWIGLATSSDGLAWTKHDDPSTTDSALGESDPVLSPGLCGELDERSVQLPRLFPGDDRLLMAYMGYGWPLDAPPSVLLAESLDDGVTWRCLTPGGALDRTGLPAGSGTHTFAAFERDGTPALLVEWLTDDGSDIWLAEAEGPLP